MLKGAGAGALAAGAVALLFGSKGTAKFAKKAAKLGGTAAIGGLAYKVYSDWQAQQSQKPPSMQGLLQTTSRPSGDERPYAFDIGIPINELASSKATQRSEALIQAMISAARADDHVDDEQMKLISRQINTLGLEQDVTRFLLTEMNQPVDVGRIAALADTPETAAELYVVSALVADADYARQRTYLDELAAALQLDGALVRKLESPLRE